MVKIQLPRGRVPAILVLAASDYRRFPARQGKKGWAAHRWRHMKLLTLLQESRNRCPARVAVDGKRARGGWVGSRDALKVLNIKTTAHLRRYLDDLEDPLGAIEIEEYAGRGPDLIIKLLPLPPVTQDALDGEWREMPYDTADPRLLAADSLLGYWQSRYREVKRRAYDPEDARRDRGAFRSCVMSVLGGAEDEPRVRVLIDAFLDGSIGFVGRKLKIKVDSPAYQQYGPTLLTFAKRLTSIGRQVEKAAVARAGALGVPLPREYQRTVGEKELEVRRRMRGYAYGKGWRYGHPLLPKHRPPVERINSWRVDADLPPVEPGHYGLGLFDEDDFPPRELDIETARDRADAPS